MPFWNARRPPTDAEVAANTKAQLDAKTRAGMKRARKRAARSGLVAAKE